MVNKVDFLSTCQQTNPRLALTGNARPRFFTLGQGGRSGNRLDNMNFTLTADKAKWQARALVNYLASIRRDITLGNALDAVARMYGTREWNVLSAALRAGEELPEPQSACGSPKRSAHCPGTGVFPDPDQPGRWYWQAGPHERSDISYDSEDEAWAALGPVGEGAQNTVAGRYDEQGNTGEVLVLRPGQPPLTKQQLREITNEGEFRLDIAVPVSLMDLFDAEDLEPINDQVSEAITGNTADLSDIGYERYTPADEAALIKVEHQLFLRVFAEWSPIDGMDDDEA